MPTTRSRRGKGPTPSPSPPPTPNTRSSINQPGSPLNITRKVLRSSTSNLNSSGSGRRGSRPTVTALYQRPLLRIAGLSEDFLGGFQADSQLRDSLPADPPHSDDEHSPEEDDPEDDHESAGDDPPFTISGSKRGRGGRRGRGRGGRVRGRPRRMNFTTRKQPLGHADSPSPLFSSTDDHESDMEDMQASFESKTNSRSKITDSQKSASDTNHAKPNSQNADASGASSALGVTQPSSAAKPSSPKLEARGRKRAAISRQSSGATPIIPAEDQAPPPEPVTENIDDLDLPPPFLERYKVPKSVKECEDKADFILKTRFEPMTNPQAFITALTKHQPNVRSTDVLYAIALNAQQALRAWQEEYLRLDKRTAPQQHPPRKPATGGRIPVEPEIFEAQKQADLYNYVYDAKKGPYQQDPYAQRLGRDLGRQLRQRRRRDVLDSAPASEEEAENEGGPRKRQRRAVQRFEGTATPEFGVRGTRKRTVAQRDIESATPEVENRPKRARVSALLPQRVAEMRVESAANSSSEGESKKPTPDPPRRRGRPPGSKNFAKRSDAGIKKGPRKPQAQASLPTSAAHTTTQPANEAGVQVMYMPTSSANTPVPVPTPRGAAPLSTILSDTPDMKSKPEAKPIQPRSAEPSRPVAPHTPGGTLMGTIQPKTALSSASSSKGSQPKTRAKSEKRSQSMTIWWAERKARAAEQKAALAKANGEVDSMSSTPRSTPKPSEGRSKRPAGQSSVHNHTPTPSGRQSSLSKIIDLNTSSPQPQSQPLSLPPLAPSSHPGEPYPPHQHIRPYGNGPISQHQHQHHLPPPPTFHPHHHHQHLPPPGPHGSSHPPPLQPLPPPPPPRTQPILAPAPIHSPSQAHQPLHGGPHIGTLPLPGMAVHPQPPSGHATHAGGVPSPYPMFGTFTGRMDWAPGHRSAGGNGNGNGSSQERQSREEKR